MNPLPPPAASLPGGALALIESQAGLAEQQGQLTDEMLRLIYREGWFKILAPKRWGGMALPLPEVVRLEEGLAYADGSLGWVVTLCSGAGWFGGFLPPGDFEALFADNQLCVAGSGSVTGEAHLEDGHYRVNGNWAYASGIRHATAYTANCVIYRDGRPQKAEDGSPLIRPFLFLPGELQLRRDWNAMGLVATGSDGFAADGLQVPVERMFSIEASAAVDEDPLYRYPFLPLAEATLAANISGLGWRFLDNCDEYFGRREMPEAVAMLQAARTDLQEERSRFHRALDRSWKERSPESFRTVSSISHALVRKVRGWVDDLYPFAGLGAARKDTVINRVWRDLHTAGQHPLLVFRRTS